MKTTGNIHDLEDALLEIIKYIDPKWKWLTMNKNGEFGFHEDKPTHAPFFTEPDGEDAWWVSNGDEETLPLILPYDDNWKECIINLEEVRGNE